MDKYKMNTIGVRIRTKRESLGLLQKDLAIAAHITKSSITQYEKDLIEPKVKPLLAIAKILGVSIEWLVFGLEPEKGEGNNSNSEYVITKKIPVLKNEDVFYWLQDLELSSPIDYVLSNQQLPERAFAVVMNGSSMLSSSAKKMILPETILIIDPETANVDLNGEIVIANTSSDRNTITIKQFEQDGSNRYLIPWNERFDLLKIDQNVKILGYVREMILYPSVL